MDHPWHELQPENVRSTSEVPTLATSSAQLSEDFHNASIHHWALEDSRQHRDS